MARFDIISKDGSIVRYSGKPRYNGSYLKPSFLEFSEIASPVPITWEVGDYVDYPRTGMRYRLYSIPQASKNARKDSHGRAFTYSNVQLHAATKELEIALFRDLVSSDNNIHFSTSPDVATFEDVYGIARRIQACMDDLYPGRWEIRVADFDESEDAEIIEKISEAKDFALSGGTCLDALSKIYELWQDIGWIHTYENGKEVITIGYANKRIADNTSDAYLYGKGNGLTAIKKNQTNKDEFATRLYVYGSERNLPSRYYNGLNILNAESVDIRNLMLPLDSWGQTDGLPDARKAYLENSDAVAKFGVIPKTHYFDSTDAGADIYPSIEGMTIGQIRKVLADMGETEYSPSVDIYPNDSERADEVKGANNPDDDGMLNRDGKQYDETQSFDISNQISMTTYATHTAIQTTFQREGKGEVFFSPDANIVILGENIVSAKVKFELADAYAVQRRSVTSTREVSAVEGTSATNWIVKMPNMSLEYTRHDYSVFPVYLIVTIYIQYSSDTGTANVIFPSSEVDLHFKRILDKTFEITLKQVGFDISRQANLGEGKVISMKSGACEGRNFVISGCKYQSDSDSWLLTCKRQQDDTLGMLFPYKDYTISEGDRFVLLEIAMPKSYIRVAMERLFAEGNKLLSRASRVQSHYEPAIDAKVMIESGRTLREGMFMEITDEDVIDNTTEHILIDTLSIYEDESAIPTYKVTLRERRKVTYKGTPSATSTTSTKSVEEDEDKEDIVVDLSNYYTKEEVNELIDEVAAGEVDLTNYYTKGEIDAKGYLTSDSLVGYAKTTEVAETYATKIALSAVDGRLASLESYFSTSEDADTQINKWNEIVAFLNATEGTTLAGILAAYYTKTEVDSKVTTINNSITALDDKYAPVKTWYDALGSLIVKDGNNVRIKTNLIVEGDTASGGTGGGAAIGVTGILVDGKPYTDNDSDGYIDLSEAFAGLSPTITSAMIVAALGYTPANSASLGSLASKDSLVASDIPDLSGSYLSTAGGTISGSLQIGNDDNISVVQLMTVRRGHFATFRNTVNEMILSFGETSTFTPEKMLAMGDSGLRYSADGGSTYNDILTSAGGTLNATSTRVLTINRTNGNNSFIFFKGVIDGATQVLGYLGFSGIDTPVFYTAAGKTNNILHAGNYSDYALPLSGGTISGTTTGPLNINTSNASEIGLSLSINSSKKAWFGYNTTLGTTQGAAYMYNAVAKKYMGILDDGSAFLGGSTLIHSGNVGEYEAGGAFALLDIGTISDANAITYADQWVRWASNIPSTAANIPVATGYQNGMLALSLNRNGVTAQLYFSKGKPLYYRSNHTDDWKTIAFTDSNVASAQALTHSNGTVGANVASSGRVDFSGNIALALNKSILDPSGRSIFMLDGNNSPQIGYDTVGSYSTYINGKDVYLRYGSSRTTGLILNSSGNVTIGSSDLASTSYKLYVSGNTCIGYNGIYGEGNESMLRGSANAISIGYGYRNLTTDIYGGTIRFYREEGTTSMLINSSGNVGIGTTSPAYKLDVEGTIKATATGDGSEVLRLAIDRGWHFIQKGSGSTTSLMLSAVSDNKSFRIGDVNNNTLIEFYASTTVPVVYISGQFVPSSNNAYQLGSPSARWSTINGVNADFSGTLTAGATTFNGDVRINGNLVVAGDTASGGTGESNVGGNLRVDYDAMWALINKTSITQAEMDAVGFTTAVVNNLAIGAYHKIVGELGDYKYVYNYECRDLGGSIQLHIYFGDDNIDNCERFYFERSAGTWTLNFYEV